MKTSMNEIEYIDRIRAEFATRDTATEEVMNKVDQALEQFPTSPALWCLRGDLIQLSDGEDYTLEDALNSYQRAIELDPNNAEAYEAIGHYYNAVNDDPVRAEPYFKKAIALGGGEGSERGLAEVLEELGQKQNES